MRFQLSLWFGSTLRKKFPLWFSIILHLVIIGTANIINDSMQTVNMRDQVHARSPKTICVTIPFSNIKTKSKIRKPYGHKNDPFSFFDFVQWSGPKNCHQLEFRWTHFNNLICCCCDDDDSSSFLLSLKFLFYMHSRILIRTFHCPKESFIFDASVLWSIRP